MPGIIMHNKLIKTPVISSSRHKSQISKLLQNSNQIFKVVGSISNGNAMKTLGIDAL
jgi:hypothetical protein